MGRGLIFVRHGMSTVDPDVPSERWGLTEAGREDCVLLAHALPERLAATVYTSAEPKAAETGAIIALRRGLAREKLAGFGEVNRPWHPGDNKQYRSTVARYLNGETIAGWEARDRVLFRFRSAVDTALETSGEHDILIATHGISPTVYVASVMEFDAVAFWRALKFPDAWRLDIHERELTHLFNGG